jgi:signal transduction histidine kinase
MRLPAGRSARGRLALVYATVLLAVVVGLLVALVLVVNASAPTVQVAVAHLRRPDQLIVPPSGIGIVHAQRAADINSLLLVCVVLMVISVLGAVPLGWFASGRMLRPLRQITARARTISAGNLHERLAITGERDEFTELGDTLDDLLGRLEASFDAQRRFVANASHELRTPLTVERTLLQVALADPNASAATLRAACEELLANGRDQERLIEALLTLASSERGLERRERVDLGALAAGVLERPRAELELHQIELEAHLEPAITEGDQDLIKRLITNLVDNAVIHNLDGGRVEVTTRSQDDRALLIVENTGLLIAPDEIETMFEPFRRLGRPRTGSAAGQHGLGLSIVRAIAEAHHAAIDARPRPGGGLSVTVAFTAITVAPPASEK